MKYTNKYNFNKSNLINSIGCIEREITNLEYKKACLNYEIIINDDCFIENEKVNKIINEINNIKKEIENYNQKLNHLKNKLSIYEFIC